MAVPSKSTVSPKDRLIIALAAQLRAERETRAALAEIVANGQLDREVLEAVLTDPVPVITQEDVAHAERLAMEPARLARHRETH
ncbi:hypothetical protein [Bosea sp. NBC_00550]|uniref:hypothetical protein n=1 Tax=Bosea sp. NBC_00550 TaxID=2969621 RepID=UPI00222E430C|nr:hypothetical protein [Bosea sp. NBC_00550]UZF91221.1 hypothetical protein NWE53_19105 [Bosea sp. NBC_00550]